MANDPAPAPAKPVKVAPRRPGGFGLASYNLDIEGTVESAAAQRALAESDAGLYASGKVAAPKEEGLYGRWQTDPWTPPLVGPSDAVPKNEHGNVELRLLNPGLSHLRIRGLARVCKKLGVDYAPCMVGFEEASGRPRVEGVVVKDCHREAVLAAKDEVDYRVEKGRETEIVRRWEKLVYKVLIGKRVMEEWG